MTSQGPRNNSHVVTVHYYGHCVAGIRLSDVCGPDWRKEEFHEIFANDSKAH